jgi:hypothetical protein
MTTYVICGCIHFNLPQISGHPVKFRSHILFAHFSVNYQRGAWIYGTRKQHSIQSKYPAESLPESDNGEGRQNPSVMC